MISGLYSLTTFEFLSLNSLPVPLQQITMFFVTGKPSATLEHRLDSFAKELEEIGDANSLLPSPTYARNTTLPARKKDNPPPNPGRKWLKFKSPRANGTLPAS
jgi:hypothetical protein